LFGWRLFKKELRAAGSSAAPWQEARFRVAEGANRARLPIMSVGGNGARLRQEPDRDLSLR
jgi:hypothetical protein